MEENQEIIEEKKKKEKKVKKSKAKKNYDKTQIVVKIIAGILAALMVLATAGTLMYSLI